MTAVAKTKSRLGISFKHVRFAPVYIDAGNENVPIRAELLKHYQQDRNWTPLFFRTANDAALSCNEFVANYLLLSKRTMLELIPPQEMSRVESSGRATFTTKLPFILNGSFYLLSDNGKMPLKDLTLEIEITVTQIKPEPKKVEITDKPFAVFAREADIDYLLARLINMLGTVFSGRAGYLAHQALEKYLKAITVQTFGEFYLTHNLIVLARRCAELNPYFTAPIVLESLKIFDEFAEVGRYGGAARFDPHARSTQAIKTAGVYMWRSDYIHRLDMLVYNCRSLLNFNTTPGQDSIQAILEDNKKNAFVGTWALHELPLRNVLTRDNKVFVTKS